MTKIYRALLVFSLALFTVGCSKDDPSGGRNKIDKSANLKSLGTSAHDLLSDDKFTSMNIEIDYVTGYQPSTKALQGFKKFLEERTFKPDGITITTRAVESSNKAPFDIDEIDAIEKENRTNYNTGDEIAVYIYYADGSNENDEADKVILGSAYRNTSMVIYGKTINDFAARSNAPEKSVIENAVLDHEFGHLFGLVDLGTEPQSDHIDPDHEGHCSVSGCLMRANLEFGSGIVNVVDGGKVPELDSQCITDLQANGGR